MRVVYRTFPFILACMLLSRPTNSAPATNSAQHTEGDQAPIVNVGPGGKSTINYGVPGELVANIVPEIKCIMAYPLTVVKGQVRRQTENPDITITNVSPIKAIGFSVDLKCYLYDKKLGVIQADTEERMITHGHLIFKKELQPAEEIKQQIGGFSGCQDKVAIYVLSFKYYREADMKAFNRQEMFFVDNYDDILPEKDYATNSEYRKIVQAIKSHRPPSDSGRTCLQAIDDHSLYMSETQKTGLALVTGGGKALTITGIPEDPLAIIRQSYANDNRPLLYIKPAKMKETGTYLYAKIVNHATANIAFRYEVENVGDLNAVKVSREGETPYAEPLAPGSKIYLNIEYPVMEKDGRQRTAEDILSDIDNSKDLFLEHHGTVFYYQESRDEVHVAKFVYRIRKDSVQLIRYEMY